MPLFSYKCTKCGHEFEKLVLSFSKRDDAQTCPKCGSPESVRKEGSHFSSRSGGGGGATYTPSCGPFT